MTKISLVICLALVTSGFKRSSHRQAGQKSIHLLLNPIFGSGVYAGYRLSSNRDVGIYYDFQEEGADEFSTGHGGGVVVKQYFGGTFYSIFGLGRADAFGFSGVGVFSSIGNEWQFGNGMTFGGDWISAIWMYDRHRNRGAFPPFGFAKFIAGWVF